jgi:hypothetical protein
MLIKKSPVLLRLCTYKCVRHYNIKTLKSRIHFGHDLRLMILQRIQRSEFRLRIFKIIQLMLMCDLHSITYNLNVRVDGKPCGLKLESLCAGKQANVTLIY